MNLFQKLFAHLRIALLAGLAAWLPLVITLWLLQFLLTSIDNLQQFLPERYQPAQLIGLLLGGGMPRHIPGLGFVMVISVLLITGLFVRNFIGSKVLSVWEGMLQKIPFVKTVYRGVKQVSDSLFSDKSNAFREAVLVQFPYAGAWTIAFVTTKEPPPIHPEAQTLFADTIGVYVPTTPNPTSGYFIWVKKSETKPINLTVEEALKAVVTMGVASMPKAIKASQ